MLPRTLVLAGIAGIVALSAVRADAAWIQIPTGTTARLNDINTVASYGGGAFLICGDGGVLLRTTDEGANWTQPLSGATADLHRISGNSSSQYYCSGTSGKVYQALNAGTSWTDISPASTARLIVYGSSSGTPRLVGDDGSSRRDENGTIGGISWVSQTTGTTESLNDAVGFYSSSCYAVGDAGTILHAADGVSWVPLVSGTTENLYDILQVSTAYMAFGANGTILRSTDAGTTWTSVASGTGQDLYEAATSGGSANFIMAVGAGGTALYSSDAGLTWCPQATGTTEDLRAVISQGGIFRWYAVGDHGILVSNDDDVTCGVTAAPVAGPERALRMTVSPNPFPAATTLSFDAPRGGPASVRIYDAAGRLLRVLTEGPVTEGRNRVAWDGRDGAGTKVPAGVYFAVVRGSGFTRKTKLIRVN